jgi:hypothetical protein
VALSGHNCVTSKCRTPNDHLGYPSPLECALLVLDAHEGSIFNTTRPPKPTCGDIAPRAVWYWGGNYPVL